MPETPAGKAALEVADGGAPSRVKGDGDGERGAVVVHGNGLAGGGLNARTVDIVVEPMEVAHNARGVQDGRAVGKHDDVWDEEGAPLAVTAEEGDGCLTHGCGGDETVSGFNGEAGGGVRHT